MSNFAKFARAIIDIYSEVYQCRVKMFENKSMANKYVSCNVLNFLRVFYIFKNKYSFA